MGDRLCGRGLALILVGVLVVILALIFSRHQTSQGSIMRVGIHYPRSVSNLDPAEIRTAFDYDILQNIYGRLLRYDEKTQLVADIPSSFSWSESEVRFVFGDKVKTIDGHLIDAQDAALSLKRLVLKGMSGHGDIRRFLCPGFKMNSLEEDCPGIAVEGNTLILRVVSPDFLSMLIGALESADYSIIPRSNFDATTGELRDKNHRNTSGPYYVEKDSETGHIVLAANPNHYLYNPEMPVKVEVVPDAEGGPLQGFVDGKIDYLPTSAYFTGEIGKALLADKSNDVNETLPISLTFIGFSKHGLNKFSPEQRLYAGLVVGAAFVKNFGSLGGRRTEQFFQTFSDGTLDENELEKVRDTRAKVLANPPVFSEPIIYGVPATKFEVIAKELEGVPGIKVVSTGVHAIHLKPEERPDMFYVITDSAWAENMTLISYSFQTGSFYLPGLDADKWFQNYISIRDKEGRMKLLRKLHFDVLNFASIVPIEAAPFFSLVRSGWKLNQSKIMIGTELWTIRRN